MIYDVRQETTYHYASSVAYARHVLRLGLIDRPDQRVQAAVRGPCFLRAGPKGTRAWQPRRLSVNRRNRWVGFRPAFFLPCRPALG